MAIRSTPKQGLAQVLTVALMAAASAIPASSPADPWPLNLEVPYYRHELSPPSWDVQALAIGDFNQDGLLDVYHATNVSDPGNRYLLGKGNGTLYDPGAASPSGPLAYSSVQGLATADFNGDGRTDVAGFGPFGDLRVYSYPSSQAVMGTMVQGDPRLIVAADLDRDGWMDIVFATAAGSVFWARNINGQYLQSNGSLIQGSGTSPSSLHVADIDSDGNLDVGVVVGSQIMGVVASSPGVFGPVQTSSLGGTVPLGDSVLLDWSGDGMPDIVYYNSQSHQMVFAQGYGTWYFYSMSQTQSFSDPNWSGPSPMIAGNFDASPGLEVCYVSGVNIVVYKPNTGPTGSLDGIGAFDAQAADMNLDGKLDLIIAEDGLNIELGNGDGTFGQGTLLNLGNSGISNPDCVAIDDLDRDGDSDVIVGGSGFAEVIRATSNDPWNPSQPDPTPIGIGFSNGDAALVTARINSDLFPDLVSEQNQDVKVFMNNGSGGFTTAPVDLGSATGLVPPAVGDVDGDGHADVVVCLPGDVVKVHRGNGAGAFTAGSSFTMPYAFGVKSIAVGQLGGSPAEDIVVGGLDSIMVVWDYGARIESYRMPMAGRYNEVAIGDVNADRVPDLVVAATDPQSSSYSPTGILTILAPTGGSTLTPWVQRAIPVMPRKTILGSLTREREVRQVLVMGPKGNLFVAYPSSGEATMDSPTIGVGGWADLFFGSPPHPDIAVDPTGNCPGIVVARNNNYGGGYNGYGAVTALRTLGSAVSMDVLPIIESPPIAAGEAGSVLTFQARASDLERDPVGPFTADLSGLPAGNTASFTAPDTAGTFTWAVPDTLPPSGVSPVGAWPVTLQVPGRARTTWVHVLPPGVSTMATFTWNTNALDEGVYNVQFTATQGGASVVKTVQIVVSAVGPPPGARTNPKEAASSVGSASAITMYAPDIVSVFPGDVVRFVASASGASGIQADLTPLPAGANATLKVDHEPVVSAPATVLVTPGVESTIRVTAQDPEGNAIQSLTALLGSLPPGTAAFFQAFPGNTAGALTVTLPANASGKYGVIVRAANALSGRAGIVLETSGALGTPRAYWKLNGNGYDESGNAPLSYFGGYGPGKFGQGLAAAGTPAYYQEGIGVNFGITNPFTIELWMKMAAPPSSDAILLEQKETAVELWGFAVQATDGQAYFYCDAATIAPVKALFNVNVADGAFHHLAVVYDGAQLSLYVDGVLTRQAAQPSLSVSGAQGVLTVGGIFMGGSPFAGTLDEVRIWNRTFASNEIASLMAGELSQSITAVEAEAPHYANRLWSAQPNPFNPSTTIRYESAREGWVELRVFDAHGRLVRTLVDAYEPAGPHQARWDGTDGVGRPVASGVYYSVYRAGTERQTKRMVLLK